MNKLIKWCLFVLPLIAITACTDLAPQAQPRVINVSIKIDSPINQSARTQPGFRAYDPNVATLQAFVDGQPASVVEENQEPGSFFVEANGITSNEFELSLRWFYPGVSGPVPIADFDKIYSLPDDSYINITAEDYLHQLHDIDQDLDSNLTELKNDTKMENSNSCSQCREDVDSYIHRISTTDAPTIDGTRDEVWNKAQFMDQSGNLEFRQDNRETVGDYDNYYPNGTDFRFAAMYDDDFLYLLILGEPADSKTPIIGDRAFVSVHNMNREIVFRNFYPMFDPSGNVYRRTNYVGCVCDGEQGVYEIRIPLNVLNAAFFDETQNFEIEVGLADIAAVEASSIVRSEHAWFGITNLRNR